MAACHAVYGQKCACDLMRRNGKQGEVCGTMTRAALAVLAVVALDGRLKNPSAGDRARK